MIDDRTEQLINRRLDGALSDAESLELDRLLIRSPEARTLLEDYQRMDGLAVEAMQSVFQESRIDASFRPGTLHRIPPAGAGKRWNLAMALAVAAMIALVLAGLPSKWRQLHEVEPQLADQPTLPAVRMGDPAYVNAPVDEIHGTRDQRQHITRNLIGLMDDKGEGIYFLEVQRKDTTVTPVSFSY